MARIILKCPYLKGGSAKSAAHLDNMVKYIATRDGVEKVERERALWHATKSQQNLISQIVREFPDCKNLFEYEDFLTAPNRVNASEFIDVALEQHLDKIGEREKYLNYIANRPHVERMDSHGLFTSGNSSLVLAEVAREVAAHTGNVWTPIISLRREDAQKFGYESAAAWKALLSSKAFDISKQLKIHSDNFRWYAAFHNESHHPHVHMICFSTRPQEGYLTKQGISNMKSDLANEIFKAELIPLYAEKTNQRKIAKEQSVTALHQTILGMQNGVLHNKKIEELIIHLAERLQHISGKKQYGYLKSDLKNLVGEIVDELSCDERVQTAYQLWQNLKNDIAGIYNDSLPEHLPLSKSKDFKPIRNMVIQEAMRLRAQALPFEESNITQSILPEPLDDEIPDRVEFDENAITELICEAGAPERSVRSWWTEDYTRAKSFLYGDVDANIQQNFSMAYRLFLAEAKNANPLAMYELGRMATDGLGCEADNKVSQEWYEKALAAFHTAETCKPWKYTEYRIGKMYAAGLGVQKDDVKAATWLTLSANQSYKYAEYSLGSLYLSGKGVSQNAETAFELYFCSANQGFPYASFALGKMLQDGIGCEKSDKKSQMYFAEAFNGFRDLGRKSHDDKLQYRLGWMLLNGVGTEKDISAAKEYFEKAATVGNPFAGYQLAKLILSEKTSEPEQVEKATVFLTQSANGGNSYAQYYLGKLYQEGQYIPKNVTQAVRLFKMAAAQGHDYAAYQLGKLYLSGDGVLKNIETALHWLHLSAEKNNPFAEYTLGMLYLKEEELSKNSAKAITFLKRSSEQGNQYAQYQLGKIYLTDSVVPQDMSLALKYLTTAAEKGNQCAQYALGKLYLMGKGVPQDREAAIKWLTRSSVQNNIYAQFFLEHLDDFKDSAAFIVATRLLHHLSRVFENKVPMQKASGPRIDRKRLRSLRTKKAAAGHKQDDHIQEQTI